MGCFKAGSARGSKLSAAWRAYFRQARPPAGRGTVMTVEPSAVVCGESTSLSFSFELRQRPAGGGFLVFDLPQGWGGWVNEKDEDILGRSGGVQASLAETAAPLEVEVISRGSRLSIIQVRFGDLQEDAGSVIRVRIPPLLPCDRPGTYGFHACVGNRAEQTRVPAGCRIAVLPGPFSGFDLFYPSTLGERETLGCMVRARSGAQSSYFTVPAFRGTVEVLGEQGVHGRRSAAFDAASGGSAHITGFELKGDVGRLKVRSRGRELQGHPVISTSRTGGFRVYFGDLHLHTANSDGMGSPEEAYRWAEEGAGLDFVALNDHVEDRLTYDPPWNGETWQRLIDEAARFNRPQRFVTIAGVEICGSINLYFDDGGFPFVPLHELDRDMEATGKFLSEISKDRRVLFGYHKPARLPAPYLGFPPPGLLEIIQHKRHPEAGIERFLPLCPRPPSFLGGTDSHCGLAGSPPMGADRAAAQYGLTGVLARDLTRAEIFRSLREGRTFATSGQRSVLILDINEALMGDTLRLEGKGSRLVARVRAWACEEIRRLDVVCNGTVIASREPGVEILEEDYEIPGSPVDAVRRSAGHSPFAGQRVGKRFIYARITEQSGRMAWTTPVLVLDSA
ncbi:MAG: hypothetical protein JXB06_03720 [Spirochaetales bacterium]|nr:hypothetical protein [Spirochaetales bacterium]